MMKRRILLILILFWLFFNLFPLESQALPSDKLEIYFFSSAICPHCAKEREFLRDLEKRYPGLEIKEYEMLYHPENKKILTDFYEKYQVAERDRGWLPITFTPTKYFLGFNEQIAREIENCIKECLGQEQPAPQKIKIPIFGEIDISKMSLLTLTVVFGALDGLNPCAMWVLIFLITLLINIRSRKRIWLIAGTFILASGIFYFLILSAWLNLFLIISYVNLTRILIGIFALGVGAWQIKNFITYHPKVCRVLGFQSRFEKELKEKAEKLVSAPIMAGTFLGIAGLAFGVNLVEFFCSAGLPTVYTRILTLNYLNPLIYYFYLLVYTFVFMLDDIIVFSLVIITLNRVGFSEKYNYWATLVGGLLIFTLGIFLIFKPEFLMFS